MRSGARPAAILRPRLLRPMAEAPVTVLEAPSGYGKSTLCVQLATATDEATISLSLATPVDVAGLIGRLDVGKGLALAGLVLILGGLAFAQGDVRSAIHGVWSSIG